jgi:hypothetical protein
MDNSMKAVFDFIRLVNDGKGMVNDSVTLQSRNVIIHDNKKQQIGAFSSDIYVQTVYGIDALIINIMNDDIIRCTGYAAFWTKYYQCVLNGSSLEVSNNNYIITIY